MRTLESRTDRDRQVTCVACATHMHPEMVPWLQHEIGCEIRLAALGSYQRNADRRTGRPVAAAASPRL